MSMDTSDKNCKFCDPGARVFVLGCGHIGHVVKLHYFFENFPLYSWSSCRQTEYKVMIIMEASTQIVNFMTPGAGVPVLRCSQICPIVKMH